MKWTLVISFILVSLAFCVTFENQWIIAPLAWCLALAIDVRVFRPLLRWRFAGFFFHTDSGRTSGHW